MIARVSKTNIVAYISLMFALAVLLQGGSAWAAWPGTSLSGVNMSMAVERGVVDGKIVHEELNTYFVGFMEGNSRSTSGSFNMTLVQSDPECNLDDSNGYVIYVHATYPGGTRNYGDCSNGDFVLNIPWALGTYDSNKDVTYYRIQVTLVLNGFPGVVYKGYRFSAKGPSGMEFGNWGSYSSGGVARPFVLMPNGTQGLFMEFHVTQQPPCTGGPFVAGISSKDYDNFGPPWAAKSSRAQEDSGGVFRPLWSSANPWLGANLTPTSSVTGATGNPWASLGGGNYQQRDTDSDQTDIINYLFSPGKTYEYYIHNLGQNNFIRLNLPFDGNPFACPAPAPSATINPIASVVGPSTIEPGQTATFTNAINTTATNTTGETYTWQITTTGPVAIGGTANGTTPITSDVAPNTFTTGSLTTPGQYCRTTTVTSKPGYATLSPGASVSQCVTVAAKPFFNVVGGDIMSNAGIRSWNDSASQSAAGSQLAALATNDILNFVTGTGLASFGDGSGLAFANTTANIPAGKYGGSYNVGSIPFAPTTSVDTLSEPVNLGSLQSKVYAYTGDLKDISGTLPAGVKATIIVSGNLYINNNLLYDAYSSVAGIPRLTIYASKISVAPSVNELHGLFYASLDFISCGTSAFASVALTGGAGYNTCNNKLTVYGSVTANKLILSRTSGTQRSGNSAETFYYSPEVWLAPSGPSGGAGLPTYDSYISLPPVL